MSREYSINDCKQNFHELISLQTILSCLMIGSKIHELNESSFKQRSSTFRQETFKARVASVLLTAAEHEEQTGPYLDQLNDYLINPPMCSFHHQPIKFLCVSPTCTSSTYTLCAHQNCRQLHANPQTSLVQLDAFNTCISSHCSSLLHLSKKIKIYLGEFRQKILMDLDKSIEKTAYIIQNVYMAEVPRLIRQKQNRQLSSIKLYQFLKNDSFDNSIQQRSKMEALRNQISQRITQFDKNMQKLKNSKQYNSIILRDILRVNEENSLLAVGKTDLKQFQSTILQFKEDFQHVFKMLKENRVPSFTKIKTIFRASQYNFSGNQFHKNVDQKGPILIIVKTSVGKRFGAFLNCKLNQRQNWVPDATGLSFIFSLDRSQVYKLRPEANARLKAAFGGSEGPQIGSGCDLYLVDSCNIKKGSGANLGGSYKLPSYLEYSTPKSRAYLAGQQFFLVEEYEVFLME